MNILNNIDMLQDELLVSESGIRGISKLVKQFKEAEIYYHKDLDGVTSAIAFKTYLKQQYGLKTVSVAPMQYGGDEFSAVKTRKDRLSVLVDFAHGRMSMSVHTDHHENQTSFDPKKQATAMVKTPSNVAAISDTISPTDIYPRRDIDAISMVDTADFAKHGLAPDDVIRAAFYPSKDLDVAKNHQMMALVTNKLLLSYKNKPNFLNNVVMDSKASLISMYNVIVKLAKKEGYKTQDQITTDSAKYKDQRKNKMIQGKIGSIKNMKNGESALFGTTVLQMGGGYMGKGNQYDRYTIFTLYPESDYLITVWPMGLIQISANPFVGKQNKHHLGDIMMKNIMPKFKSKLSSIPVTLDYIKYTFERDIKGAVQDAMGFTFEDITALFGKQLKGLESKNKWWPEIIKDITNKPYKYLSKNQKAMLQKISITAWDIIMTQSGGHKSITNLSGLNFLGEEGKGIMADIATETAKYMKDKQLG